MQNNIPDYKFLIAKGKPAPHISNNLKEIDKIHKLNANPEIINKYVKVIDYIFKHYSLKFLTEITIGICIQTTSTIKQSAVTSQRISLCTKSHDG